VGVTADHLVELRAAGLDAFGQLAAERLRSGE
jgi:hypothetical protein